MLSKGEITLKIWISTEYLYLKKENGISLFKILRYLFKYKCLVVFNSLWHKKVRDVKRSYSP